MLLPENPADSRCGSVVASSCCRPAVRFPVSSITRRRSCRGLKPQTARMAVKGVLEHLRSLALAVKAAGIPSGSKPIPQDLSLVLRSHPLIHSAEGVLFGEAIASACKDCGLAVISVRERQVWLDAATTWGLKDAGLRKQVDGLRKSVGAPWGTDQKTATAAALLALRSGH